MEMILVNVAALSNDWRAWVVAGLISLKAIVSIFFYFRCPVVRGVAEIDETMIATGKSYRLNPPFSFAILMLLGMGLAIAGLYKLYDSSIGPIALGAIVVGVFLFLTEPTRLFVNASKMEVFATTGGSEEANGLARDRLRSAHLERAGFEIATAAAVLAVLYFL
ncbi:MAG: hypothetical protein AAF360_03165 [Pseudomonadota bacterium]